MSIQNLNNFIPKTNLEQIIASNLFSTFNPVPYDYKIHDVNIIIDAKERFEEELKDNYCKNCIFYKENLKEAYPNTYKALNEISNGGISFDIYGSFTQKGHLHTDPKNSQIISLEIKEFRDDIDDKNKPLTKIHCKNFYERDLFVSNYL